MRRLVQKGLFRNSFLDWESCCRLIWQKKNQIIGINQKELRGKSREEEEFKKIDRKE